MSKDDPLSYSGSSVSNDSKNTSEQSQSEAKDLSKQQKTANLINRVKKEIDFGFSSSFLEGINSNGATAHAIMDEYRGTPALRLPVDITSKSVARVDVKTNDDNLESILQEPVKTLSLYDWLNLIAKHLLLNGTAILWLVRQGGDWQLAVIPPTHIDRTTNGDYRIEFSDDSILPSRTVSRERIIFMREADIESPYTQGYGKGQTLADELDVASLAAKMVASRLKNDSIPSTLVSLKEIANDDSRDAVEESFKSNHRGPSKQGKVHAVSGDVSVEKIQNDFEELQLLEQREHSSQVSRNMYSLPPELAGIVENSNRSTIDAAEYLHLKNNVKPLITKISNGLNQKLIPRLNDFASFDLSDARIEFDDFIPDDKDFKFRAMKNFPDTFSKNEIRNLVGMKTREDWDQTSLNGSEMPPLSEGEEDEEDFFVVKSSAKSNTEKTSIFEDLGVDPENAYLEVEKEEES